ncbi:hypothetical protein GJAV_G00263460 [Gymnothorax javanicus]|nr:hypothetical protein GJAV_G00263460 [Gymnothorax javanicus]
MRVCECSITLHTGELNVNQDKFTYVNALVLSGGKNVRQDEMGVGRKEGFPGNLKQINWYVFSQHRWHWNGDALKDVQGSGEQDSTGGVGPAVAHWEPVLQELCYRTEVIVSPHFLAVMCSDNNSIATAHTAAKAKQDKSALWHGTQKIESGTTGQLVIFKKQVPKKIRLTTDNLRQLREPDIF